ncbi:unnamed protein product [Lactuca saligna]|uniref:Glycine dehydrogenase (aminomethyl-transferring) n=1 Tax=Lactuca saligna TaxID=75948 RepID=A0AA35ZTY2_LACSI|nr:unnamed protein product [Lactuca saligna]
MVGVGEIMAVTEVGSHGRGSGCSKFLPWENPYASFSPTQQAQGYQARGDHHGNVCIIPVSTHGTNPTSATMCGMKIIIVGTDSKGNINIEEVRKAPKANKEYLSALMVTYLSTHGVYEEGIDEICKIIHDNGGQVYMDGANMNAQIHKHYTSCVVLMELTI